MPGSCWGASRPSTSNGASRPCSGPRAAETSVEFDTLVVALGAVTRTAPIPGLLEHAVGFKSVAEAI